MTFYYFLIAAFLAEIIGTIAGFGSATVLVPAAASIFEIKKAIALVGLFHFFGQLVDGFIWRKHIIWRIGLLFAVLGVIFSFIGALLVTFMPSRLIQIALGAFLIGYAGRSLLGKPIRIPTSNKVLILVGGAIGFIAGLLGTAGALRVAALSSLNLKKDQFLGTSFAIAFLVDLTRVSVYLKSGILEMNLATWAWIFAAAILGSLVGKRIVYKIPAPIFYKFIYFALFLAGVKFIVG